jgi:hypothetical protein
LGGTGCHADYSELLSFQRVFHSASNVLHLGICSVRQAAELAAQPSRAHPQGIGRGTYTGPTASRTNAPPLRQVRLRWNLM